MAVYPSRPGVLTAVSLLLAFKRGMVELTPEAYDEAFDRITWFLEECNDERHRLADLDAQE